MNSQGLANGNLKSGGEGVACGKCTFVSRPGVRQCEMCEADLSAPSSAPRPAQFAVAVARGEKESQLCASAEDLGLDIDSIRDDEGQLGAENMGRAVEMAAQQGLPLKSRLELSQAVKMWVTMVPNPLKLATMLQHLDRWFCALASLLLPPPPGSGGLRSDDPQLQEGLQVAENLVECLCLVEPDYKKTEFALQVSPLILNLLASLRAANVSLGDEEDDRMGRRKGDRLTKCVLGLFRALPHTANAYSGGWALEKKGREDEGLDVVAAVGWFVRPGMPASLQDEAGRLLASIAQHLPYLVRRSQRLQGNAGGGPSYSSSSSSASGVVGPFFERLAAGDEGVLSHLSVQLFDAYPEVFIRNIDKLVDPPSRFMRAYGTLNHMAQKNPKDCLSIIEPLCVMLEDGSIPYNMDTAALNLLRTLISAAPAALSLRQLHRITPRAMQDPNGQIMFALLLGEAGKGKDAARNESLTLLMLELLGGGASLPSPISNSSTGATTVAGFLECHSQAVVGVLLNMTVGCSNAGALLAPYERLLRSKESSNGIAVRRMLDMIITNQMDRGKGAGHRQVKGGPDLEVRLAKLELSVKHNANLVGKSEKPLDAPRSESGTEQWELVSGNKPYNDQNGAGKSKTKSLEERVEGLEEKVGQLAEDVGRILRALHAARINVK